MPHNHDPRQWEEDIRAFEAGDIRKPPPAHPLLFVGSSSIRFWRLKKFFPDHYRRCLNRGFGGSGLPDLLHYFDRLVVNSRPRAIVLYSGENDIGHGASPESVIADFNEVADRSSALLPGTALLILPLKPSPALRGRWSDMQEVNAHLERMAGESPRLDTIDTATALLDHQGEPDPRFYMRDQLHLSQDAYHVWSDLVRPWVEHRFDSLA